MPVTWLFRTIRLDLVYTSRCLKSYVYGYMQNVEYVFFSIILNLAWMTSLTPLLQYSFLLPMQ